MKHRGMILKQRIEDSGLAKTKLAKSLGVSTRTVYDKFEKSDLDYDFILKVGHIIRYDFSKDFPELAKMINEPMVPYSNQTTPAEYRAEIDSLKDELLAAYREITDLRQQLKTTAVEKEKPAHKSG